MRPQFLPVALVLASFCIAPAQQRGTPVRKPSDPVSRSTAVSSSWSAMAMNHVAALEYHASPSSTGLQAPNRAQNFRTRFRNGSIELSPRAHSGGRWTWRWETTRWGRESALRRLGTATPELIADRVEYDSGPLKEWYANSPAGLEQAFTITAPPQGNGLVRVEGRVTGLGFRMSQDGKELVFESSDGREVLRYGALSVLDARGRTLPSWLRAETGTVHLVFDDRGAEYPITIDPLLSTPSWTVAGGQMGAGLGSCTSTAGDVNGDGFSDVLVGAPSFDDGELDEGRVFLFLGSSAGLSSIPASWVAEGNQAGAAFGASVAAAGDVNGDGYGDVIVGAPHYSDPDFQEGAAFVYLGSASGLGSAVWSTEGSQVEADYGASVATAGDVNGDGLDDVIVGAPKYDNGQTNEGRAFVYMGDPAGISGSAPWTAEAEQDSAALGSSVAPAGDVNGDGYADVVIGSPTFDGSNANEGAAFAFHGSAGGLGASGTPANSDWAAYGGQIGARLGASVMGSGDVDGDGYADVAIGVPDWDGGEMDEGKALLFRGTSSGLAGAAAWSAESNQISASFGAAVAPAGDVNGDGFADLIVGAPLYDNGQLNEGRAFIYTGSGTGLSAVAAWSAESDQADARYGSSVGTGGDVNGDGYGDPVVGAPLYMATFSQEGRAYLYLGSGGGPAQVAGWTFSNFPTSTTFGFSVSTAGDVNGDGYSDVIVGAPGYDSGQTDEGGVFVFLGSPSGPSTLPTWSAQSNLQGVLFGNSVTCAGDVNGDGYSDIAVGAPLYSNGSVEEGAVFVWFGSAAGLGANGTPQNADWVAESNSSGARLGIRVAGAGDVNGDGFGDIVMGAYTYGLATSPVGRAYLYYGSATVPNPTPWIVDGTEGYAEYGYSVASAGDVNGDGFSDVAVGEPRSDGGGTDRGAVYVYLGSKTGLQTSAAWTAAGDQDSTEYGYRAVTAGDVNGDGYSDLLITAPLNNNGQIDEGRAFVYLGSSTGLGPNGTPGNADWFAESNQIAARLGLSAAAAGDVNGDGYGDIILGAALYSNGQTHEGTACLYLGSATGLGPSGTPANADWSGEGNQDSARYGIAVANAGDVNGDGFSDVIVGADLWDLSMAIVDNGQALVYYGNGSDGLDHRVQQYRSDGAGPLDLLGKCDATSSFQIRALGRTPAGRGRVRLAWEVQPWALTFNGTGKGVGPWMNTGAPVGGTGSSVALSGLASGRAYGAAHHWRARLVSSTPFFPRSPWFSLPYNSPTETDLRMGGVISAVEEDAASAPRLTLQPPSPNPTDGVARFVYSLPPGGGNVRLALFDVQGRLVRLLVQGRQTSGPHAIDWDGQGTEGRRLSAGVYFAELELGGAKRTEKIILLR